MPAPRGAGRLAWRPRPVLGLQAAAGVPVDPSLSIAPCWSEGTRRGGHGHMMARGARREVQEVWGAGPTLSGRPGAWEGQAAPLPAFMLVVKPAGPRGEPRRGRRPSGRQREPRCKIRKHRRAAPACPPPPFGVGAQATEMRPLSAPARAGGVPLGAGELGGPLLPGWDPELVLLGKARGRYHSSFQAWPLAV